MKLFVLASLLMAVGLDLTSAVPTFNKMFKKQRCRYVYEYVPQIYYDTVFTKKCQPTYKNECTTEYSTQCHVTHTTKHETVCNTVITTEYTTNYRQVCNPQSVKSCENKTQQPQYGRRKRRDSIDSYGSPHAPVCVYHTTSKCKQVPKQEAVQVPKKQCHQVVKQVPQQACSQAPVKKCKQVHDEKCLDVPHKVARQTLVRRPRRVCNNRKKKFG